MKDPAAVPWKTAATMHEGYSLLLRCPARIPLERQADFPLLVVITHDLDDVALSGLPERSYNDRLSDFDHAAIVAFSQDHNGVTVLVETFGGRRIYYEYVSRRADVDAIIGTLQARFPELRLTYKVREDADWGFIRNYADKYSL